MHEGGVHAAAPSASSRHPNRKEGSQLAREVIAWLQTLGISHDVRQPRRDLANGVWVARICAHYWPQQVSVNSFVDRLHHDTRRRNWESLRRILHKRGVAATLFGMYCNDNNNHSSSSKEVRGKGNSAAVSNEEAIVEAIINEKGQYAERFLEKLYSVLTGRPPPDTRAAEPIAITALCAAGKAAGTTAGNSKPSQSTPTIHAAIDVVECVVRRVGVKEGWILDQDKSQASDPTAASNAPYLCHFLAMQQSSTAVWSMLLANVSTLATFARDDTRALTKLFRLFLLRLSSAPERGGVADKALAPDRVFAFFAAIMSCLASVDPHFAAASLTEGILHCPGMGVYLATMDLAGARGVALLLTAVAPIGRAKSRQLLPDLLSTTYAVLKTAVAATLTGSSEARSRLPVVRLLCALLDKCGLPLQAHPGLSLAGQRPPAHPDPPSSALPHDTPNPSPREATHLNNEAEEGGKGEGKKEKEKAKEKGEREALADDDDSNANDDVVAYGGVLHRLAQPHAVGALTAESPALRLAGAALCVRLVASLPGRALGAHVDRVLPLLLCQTARGGKGALSGFVHAAEAAAWRVYLAQWWNAVRRRGWKRESGSETAMGVCPALRLLHTSLTEALRAGQEIGGMVAHKAALALELADSVTLRLATKGNSNDKDSDKEKDDPSVNKEEMVDDDATMVDAIVAFLTTHASTEVCQGLMRPAACGDGSADTSKEPPVVVLRLQPFGYAVELCGIFERLPPLLACEAVLRYYESDISADYIPTTLSRASGASTLVSCESSQQRVAWLHRAIITGRSENQSLRATPYILDPNDSAESELRNALSERWRAVLRNSARDVIQVVTHERILQKQRANRILRGMLREIAEQNSEEIQWVFELAGMAHRIIKRWYVDLAPLLTPDYDLKRHPGQAKPDQQSTTTVETLQVVLAWFQDNFIS